MIGSSFAFDTYGKTWLAYKNKEQAERKGEIVELPFKLGDRLFYVEYDGGGLPCDISSQIFIGGNKEYAFLSPTIYDGEERETVDSLCEYYFNDYQEYENECDCIVAPYAECFLTKQEAERRLEELKGELCK